MKRKLLLALIYALLFSRYIPLVYGAEGDYIGFWNLNALNDYPIGITTDGTNIWITDYTDKAVYKYDMDGVYDTFWNLNALNDYPIGITTDGTNIWITDYTDKAVYKYDMDGVYDTFWNLNALNDYPMGITTDGTNIWVVEYVNKKVYKYDMDGVYDTFWNLNALNDYPMGITTDGTNIWITDYTDKAIYQYESGGIVYLTPDVPTELFGAGFNSSSPYVELYWNHNNLTLVDVFEVQNSTDKISWDTLGYNTTMEYTDYQVVNGTDRYYRVRACKEQPDGWHNSSWIDDFEKVYFLKGGNGIGGGGVGGGGISILEIVMGVFIFLTLMLYRRHR